MNIRYYKELDGVRAIAALMVMFFHFCGGIVTNNSFLLLIKKVSIFGQTGVSLFFVLSGFLITRLLLNSKTQKKYFFNFYIKRVLRIFPLYYFFLLVFYFVLPLVLKTPLIEFKYQYFYWIYLQNFAMTFNWFSNGPSHFWSLAVEEHFYFFWPFIIYFFCIKKIIVVIFLVIILSILTRVILIKYNYDVFYFTFSRMDELALGALLAVAEIKHLLTNKNSKVFLLLFVIVLIPTLLIWILNNASGNNTLQVFKFILLATSFFSLIGYVITVKESSILKKLLCLKPILYTGKISYGLYVYHPLCFFLFNKYISSNSFILNLVGSFLLSYLTSSLSYYFIELRFLNLKKYFISNPSPKNS